MLNQRDGLRFRIPWLGAARVPRPGAMTSRNETTSKPTTEVTSPIASTGTQVGAPPSATGSIPQSPPPSPTPSRVLMSPRTVFSPRLVPRAYQLTSPQQSSPPPSLPASLQSSPTRVAPQTSVVSPPPQTPPRYFLTSPLLSPNRKAASPVPESKGETNLEASPRFPPRQTPEPPSKNITQSQTGTTLPSEKIVLENPVVVPPESRSEIEKRPKDQADEGDEKLKKGKGPLKGEKSKADPKPEESRRRSRRAAHTYTFHGKPPIKTRPSPPPPPPPPRPPATPPPPSLQKSIKEDVSKLIHELTTGRPKEYHIAETPVDMVTLAGENKGAMIRLGSEASKEKSIYIHREYKTDPNASITDDEDEDDKEKFNQIEEKEESDVEAFVNSNVQGVNNSMVVDSSMSEKNPGVHMSIYVADIEEVLPPATEKSPETLPETRRAEFSPTPSQKLTYEKPMVKRRCLRGLFMDSSESDPDDPTKQRRHGCRYRCDEKIKDKGKGISIS